VSSCLSTGVTAPKTVAGGALAPQRTRGDARHHDELGTTRSPMTGSLMNEAAARKDLTTNFARLVIFIKEIN
jgi:hypothetical protein